MRIGLSMRVAPAGNYVETRDAISHDWPRFLSSLGLTPVLIPNVVDDAATYARQLGIQGLILTGGNSLYAAAIPPPPDSSVQRDNTEMALLRMATADKLPVLGVCRGLQLINMFFGGGVTANFMDAHWHGTGHVATEHPVDIVAPIWQQWGGSKRIQVNSFHVDAVFADEIAASLQVAAVCDEGRIVEGIRHTELPIAAVQWHPERPKSAAAFDRALMERLFTPGSCAS